MGFCIYLESIDLYVLSWRMVVQIEAGEMCARCLTKFLSLFFFLWAVGALATSPLFLRSKQRSRRYIFDIR